MGKVGRAGCALVFFGSLALLASAALAQSTCTPAVFAFRHAEDTNPKDKAKESGVDPDTQPIFALTPTGQRHADLYKDMVPAFVTANHFCPITTVYAATTVTKVNGQASATNAFDTATPLAQQIMEKDPIIKMGPPAQRADQDKVKYRLYEYLGNGDDPPKTPNYSTDVATALRNALLATANSSQSSAIFWTSQGLHVLGGVITGATSNVPDKNGSPKMVPPRNAVYVFTAIGTAPDIKQFSDTPLRAKAGGIPNTQEVLAGFYVQCFNYIVDSNQPGGAQNGHFINGLACGYYSQNSLGGSPGLCLKGDQCGLIANDDNQLINGQICATTGLSKGDGPDLYGNCPTE